MATSLTVFGLAATFAGLAMPAQADYSSIEFYRDWRFAIEHDFLTSANQPFPYAEGGEQEWNDEIKKLPFDKEVGEGVISADGKYLAVASGVDIYVFDTTTWETVATFEGEEPFTVTRLAFNPADSNILVSADEGFHSGSEAPTINVWSVDEAGNVDGGSGDAPGEGEDEVEEWDELRIRSRSTSTAHKTLGGRILTQFQSNVFSTLGNYLAYIPGPYSPDTPNDIHILSTEDFSEHIVLKGHTDSIMWVGWSSDESYIASVCWDGTARIWDAETGEEIYKFSTDGQNWTGAFSPNNKYFAFTSGQGELQIRDLTDGSLVWSVTPNRGWKRDLAWHPDGNLLAVGAESGIIYLLDVEAQEIVQKRTLSTEASNPDTDEKLSFMLVAVEVYRVKFFGDKLAFFTAGDGSVEVYDIEDEVKWRFARGGTGSGPNSDEWRDENNKVTTKGGYTMAAWEDQEAGEIKFASVDYDAVRIWSVPLN